MIDACVVILFVLGAKGEPPVTGYPASRTTGNQQLFENYADNSQFGVPKEIHTEYVIQTNDNLLSKNNYKKHLEGKLQFGERIENLQKHQNINESHRILQNKLGKRKHNTAVHAVSRFHKNDTLVLQRDISKDQSKNVEDFETKDSTNLKYHSYDLKKIQSDDNTHYRTSNPQSININYEHKTTDGYIDSPYNLARASQAYDVPLSKRNYGTSKNYDMRHELQTHKINYLAQKALQSRHDAKISKSFNSHYRIPSPESSYGILKSVDSTYNVSNKNIYSVPNTLAESYDVMQAKDQAYGIATDYNTVYSSPANNAIPKNSNEYSHNTQRNINNEYLPPSNVRSYNNTIRDKTENTALVYNNNQEVTNVNEEYGLSKIHIDYDDNYPINYGNHVTLGDSFAEHVSIASKHIIHGQNSGSDDYDVPSDSYTNYVSEIRNNEEFGQQNIYNNNNFRNFNDNKIFNNGVPKYLSNNYGVTQIISQSNQPGHPEVISARKSPGKAGITQAIVRNNAAISAPNSFIFKSNQYPVQRQKSSHDQHKHPLRSKSGQIRKSYKDYSKNPSMIEPARATFESYGSNRQYGAKEEGYQPELRDSNDRFSNTVKEHSQEHPLGGNADRNEPVTYNFEYAVSDYDSESDFGHRESREYESTKGSYHVLLPDGRKQIVEYVADENGFKPNITYQEPDPSVAARNSEYDQESVGRGINSFDKYEANSQNNEGIY